MLWLPTAFYTILVLALEFRSCYAIFSALFHIHLLLLSLCVTHIMLGYSVFLLAAYSIDIGLLVILVHYRHYNSPLD